jgi:GcrA cell cycle regulator
MAVDTWTNERVAHLRRLWSEGHSAAEIGRRLGLSKNSIIGRARRDDLPARPNPVNQYANPKDRYAARPTRVRPVKTLPDLASLALRLGDAPIVLVPKTPPKPAPQRPAAVGSVQPCCWPLGNGQPWQFCNKRSAPGKPYCAEHNAIAYHRAPAAATE